MSNPLTGFAQVSILDISPVEVGHPRQIIPISSVITLYISGDSSYKIHTRLGLGNNATSTIGRGRHSSKPMYMSGCKHLKYPQQGKTGSSPIAWRSSRENPAAALFPTSIPTAAEIDRSYHVRHGGGGTAPRHLGDPTGEWFGWCPGRAD